MASADWQDTPYIFTTLDGAPIHPEHVSDRIQVIARQAKVPDIGLHGCRHTAASVMIAAGIPLKVVSEWLGDSTIGITANTYGHMMQGALHDAADAFAAAVPV